MEKRLHRADDLTPEMKQAAETLLGRKLREGEIVGVTSYEPHVAEHSPERAEFLPEMAERSKRVRQA